MADDGADPHHWHIADNRIVDDAAGMRLYQGHTDAGRWQVSDDEEEPPAPPVGDC